VKLSFKLETGHDLRFNECHSVHPTVEFPMRSYRPVNAALRVLDVLQAVNRLEAANVSRIARMTGLSSATVVRMLETLVEGGFVIRSTDRPVYYPTERTIALSEGFMRRSDQFSAMVAAE
jgi:DNA-binding IclR family transcriptional regulator